MKVLLVSVKSEVSHGGIAVWTKSYLEGCDLSGIAVDLVNVEMRGQRAADGTAKRNLLDEVRRTNSILKQLRVFLKKTDCYTVAHLNTSCGSFGLLRDYIVAKRIVSKGIPLVTHYHCDIPRAIRSERNKRYLGKLVRISKDNLVLCEGSRLYLEKEFGCSAEKIPNFVDDALILREGRTVSENLERAFFVGRVGPQKGVAEIYELARRFPDLTFILVGEVSRDVLQWEKPGNVQLLGGMSHEQVIEQIDRADVFIFPSHSEGFSVALLESMARGLPAVATDVGAAADMLADGCGLVVKKGDVDAMERAMREVQSPVCRQEISQKAIRKVRECYTREAVIQRLVRLYNAEKE